jgi:hypothetical protein
VWVRPAAAEHTVITSSDRSFVSADGRPWNGIKVYLSSPRHRDSGSRGECRNPGWEENINGRFWNFYAANSNYYNETYDSGSPYRSLRSRAYAVTVSANARDDRYLANRTASDNWGARVHLVTHTNAQSGGCGGSASYLLEMWKAGNEQSSTFASVLVAKLDPVTPGGANRWAQDNLAELNARAAYRAYSELIFHTNRSAQHWFAGQSPDAQRSTWRYGWAIDSILNYPR